MKFTTFAVAVKFRCHTICIHDSVYLSFIEPIHKEFQNQNNLGSNKKSFSLFLVKDFTIENEANQCEKQESSHHI